MSGPSWRLERVHIENYRSILRQTLELGEVTVLVGRNGAGKSNVLDAVQFLGDAVRQGLAHAVESRGHRGRLSFGAAISAAEAEIPNQMRLEAEFSLDGAPRDAGHGWLSYGFALGPPGLGPYAVQEEWLAANGHLVALLRGGRWLLNRGRPVTGIEEAPTDRLVLPSLLVAPPFNLLKNIRTLAPNPELIRPPQEKGDDQVLNRQGTNLYACWGRLEKEAPDLANRIALLLRQLVPQAKGIQHHDLGSYSSILVDIAASSGISSPQDGARLSDGTLRALALLVGLYQPAPRLLTAIEEPESFIHPHAVELLLEALIGAPERGQLLLTTQSPVVVDASAIRTDMLRVVEFRDGHTQVGAVAEEQEQDLRQHLVTGGELLSEDSLAMRPPASPARSLRPDFPG